MTPTGTRMTARAHLGLTLSVAVGLLVAACSSSGTPAVSAVTNPKAAPPAGSWPYPNGDLANTRDAPDSVISASNVSSLQQAWAFKLPAPTSTAIAPVGALTAPPVVTDGVVYLQDQDANVYALALASGKLKWEYQVNVPEKSGPGPDGVAVAGGAVYVATIDLAITYTSLSSVTGDKAASAETGEVEALSLATGKVEWDTKVPSMLLGAATVSNDLLFTTQYNGVLIALDRSTGAIVYRHQLPTSANAPIAVFGNTVLVPADGPQTSASGGGGNPQLVAYTVP